METSFEGRLDLIIKSIILPQYSNIKSHFIEVFHRKKDDYVHILYLVNYSMKIETNHSEVNEIKNETRTMFRFLGPDVNQGLDVFFYPAFLNR